MSLRGRRRFLNDLGGEIRCLRAVDGTSRKAGEIIRAGGDFERR